MFSNTSGFEATPTVLMMQLEACLQSKCEINKNVLTSETFCEVFLYSTR